MANLDLEGHPRQVAFWKSPARYKAFVGGIGSGKTLAGVCHTLLSQAKTTLVIAPTYPMLRDAVAHSFLEHLPRQLISRYNRSEMTLTLADGRTILLRSADRGGDRLRGSNVGLVWLDEAALVPESVWHVAIGRLREAPGKAILTTTPRGKDWIWRQWVQDATDDHALIQCASHDNVYLPSEFTKTLEKQYSSTWQQQELLGRFIDPEGAIFQRSWFEFISAAPKGLRWVRYWDLAFSTKKTADYTASVRAAMSPDGTIYFDRAISGRWGWPQARRIITQTCVEEPGVMVGVESVGAQLGPVQDLLSLPELAATELRPITPKGDKVTRSQPLASRSEQGRVKLVSGPWCKAFLDELCLFPSGAHDDQVDAANGCLQLLGSQAGPVRLPRARKRSAAW